MSETLDVGVFPEAIGQLRLDQAVDILDYRVLLVGVEIVRLGEYAPEVGFAVGSLDDEFFGRAPASLSPASDAAF